jgi:predicted DNA-binding transcriptional regulator AlpA
MNPWVDHGVIYNVEANHIINNLNNLIRHNELMPPIPPKLLTQAEVAEMLGLGLSNFKALEKKNTFPFKRRMLGGSVRYSNLSVIEYIKSTEFDVKEEADASKNQLSETE